MKRKLTFVYRDICAAEFSKLCWHGNLSRQPRMQSVAGKDLHKGVGLMKQFSLCMLVAMCFLPFVVEVVASEQLGGYHLLKKVPLGSATKGALREYFDYITVDAADRRVYLSHGTEVMVVNADDNAVIGTIPGLKLAHGTLLLKDLGRGFISDGGSDRVVIFDLKSLKTLGEIKTGGNPDCIMYDSASKHIFTFNGRTKDSTVIDPATAAVIATVPMGGRAEFAAADGNGTIYDNIEDTNEVVVLDSRTLKIKARWPMAPTATPTALAMDVKHRRLFIGGRNKNLAIMDADTGKVLQTFPITTGVDANIYDADSGLLYVSTREAIHIFHEDTPDKFTEVETVKTEFGAKTMGLDTRTHRLFLDTADFGPPPPATQEEPHPESERVPIPGTFRLLIYGR
jgi:DNA-binding beta-propeller fold protein YncE